MRLSRKAIFATGSAVAVCPECGNIHFGLVDRQHNPIAATLMSPAEALGLAETLVKAATEIRERDAGGQAKCH